MFKGGQRYDKRSMEFFRLAGLLLPVIFIVYGLLVRAGAVDHSHYVSDSLFALIAIAWAVVAVVQAFSHNETRRHSTVRLATYYTLFAVYVLFVSGFSTPFIVCLLILCLVGQGLDGTSSARLGASVLAVIGLADSIYWTPVAPQHIAGDLLSIITIIVSAFVLIFIVRSQDVSKKELSKSQAQEGLERERLQTLINNMADAVLSTDNQGIINIYNAASLNLLDTNDSLHGHRVSEILALHDADDRPVNLFKELKDAHGVIVRDDLYYLFSDNEKIRLEITCSPIRGSYTKQATADTQNGFIIILRDITKQKSLEEERDEFISVVSHELRTPITIVEGTLSNTQLMMERGAVEPAILKTQVDTAHDQVIYLAKMVNDLSTLSRAERGVADTPEEIDAQELVHALYTQYEDEAHKKGLQFNLEADPKLGTILVSRLYVEELIQNFITNAIKYTVEGTVVLSAHVQNGSITFAVKDSGIGMSKSDQKRIFEKFYRAEDYRTRETNGTGLGLYVAAKLARKIGTTIELTSRLNHGSTFGFTLPLNTKK